MTHTAPASDTRRNVILVSPLGIVLVLVSVYGLVQFYRGDQLAIVGAGWPAFFAAAAIWVVYGALAVAVLILLQRYARRPAWTVALAVAWGAGAAVYFAALANDAFAEIFQNAWDSEASIWTAGPVVEETMKALGVLCFALVPVLGRFRAVDGLFYGVVAGAGFQIFENFQYTVAAVSQSGGGGWEALWTTAFVRGVFDLFTHAVWTGIAGAAIGWVAAGGRPGRAVRVLGAAAAFATAVTLHAVDDFFAVDNRIALMLAVDLVGFLILVVVLLQTQRSEKRRLTTLAIENDGWGVLDTSDLGEKGHGRAGRKLRRAKLRYAYSRDQHGAGHRLTKRAAARLV